MQKTNMICSLLMLGTILGAPALSRAQYCTPVVNTSGISLIQISFANTYGITNGVVHYTGNNAGYSQDVALTSGTANRYFPVGFFYSISNPTGSVKPYDFAAYADWNNDGDFNDAGEQPAYPITGTVNANTSLTTGTQFFPPLNTPAGNYRVRMVVSQNGSNTATACGPITGEVEDYMVTIGANTAPVLNTTASPLMNSLLVTQTNSNGISVNEFISSSEPGAVLISDADDQSGPGFYNKVPRGIAIYGQTATNGAWQYKIGTGSWTSFGSLSSTNALLLLADGGITTYQPGTRIRFVPTGTGTPTFSFKAWDGTAGVNGSYANSTIGGGATSLSTASLSASLNVLPSNGYDAGIYFGAGGNFLYQASLNRVNKTISNPEPLLSNATDYAATDIDYEATTNKLYWINAPNNTKIVSSNADGTNAQLSLISGLNYATGLAVGNGSIYYLDWNAAFTGVNIVKAKTNGTGITNILSSTTYTDIKDIEFYKNKLYFQYTIDGVSYNIAQLDTTGSNLNVLYSTSGNYFSGLAVANDTLYWTEGDGTLKKKAIAGGAVTTLVPAGEVFSDLIVDPINATVYYVNLGSNSSDRYSLIRKIATTGGASNTISTLTGVINSLTFNDIASTPLPLSLLGFTGNYDAQNGTAVLNWETATEQDHTTFVLERSMDGMSFSPITTIAGKAEMSQRHQYVYNDPIAQFSADKFYYRLKQVDADKTFSYSQIIVLNKGENITTAKVWPNPAKGLFNVHLSAVPSGIVKADVYSLDGKLLLSKAARQQDFQINLSEKSAGVYYLKVMSEQGLQLQFTLVKE